MDKLNIKPEHYKMLTEIFDNYCPQAEIWAYGSRLNGDSHEGSDLDLVVKSFGEPNLQLENLKSLLSDSNIPFLIDINEFDKLPKSFQEEITKNYAIIYK